MVSIAMAFPLCVKSVFDKCGYDVKSHIPDLGKALGEELLTPTRIYTETILGLTRDLPIHGLVHVTGGGIDDNIVSRHSPGMQSEGRYRGLGVPCNL